MGEGNGNPLQCSCLENSRDERAWWAAVYGVTQSQTRLKQLSSSSSIFSFQDRKSNVSELQQPCPSPGLIGVKVKVKSLSRVQLFVTPWTIAHQVPPSMEFSRQYWGVLPFPSPGESSQPGIEPRSPALQADALTSEPPGKTLIGVASSVTKWLLRKSNVWHFVINHPGTPLFVIFFLFYLLSFSSLLFFFLLSLFVIPQSLLSYVDL